MRPLLITPPAEFVAARNALVKGLKAEGRRDEASRIAAIRRPTWIDWALNTAADAEPDLAGAFADAADATREAQAAAVEGRPADVAGALRTLRERATALAKSANAALTRAGRPPDIADLTERLAAVAADTTATDQLRAGVLRAGDGDGDAIAGLPDVATTASAPVSAAPAPRATARNERAAHTPRHAPAVDPGTAERAAERRRLMREIADVERTQRTIAHELARAERAVDEAMTKRATAQAAAARAEDELRAAQQRLADTNERCAILGRDAEHAERQAAVLRAELDQLAHQSAG